MNRWKREQPKSVEEADFRGADLEAGERTCSSRHVGNS